MTTHRTHRSRRHGLAVSLIALVITLVVTEGLWHQRGGHPPGLIGNALAGPVSQPRPDFTLPDMDGVPRPISDWDGKVLAINFWATWCAPCVREMPAFNALQQEYGERGLQFIGVAMDDQAAITGFMKKIPIQFPVLVGEDAAMEIAIRYGDEVGILPYTVIVDRQGRIAYVRYGELTPEMARPVIESLL